MSDLDLPIRDRTYREPAGPHLVMVRGRDLEGALEHLASRRDCRALAIIGGLPARTPDLGLMAGRRLLVCGGDRTRMRELAEAGIAAGGEVEWIGSDRPALERLAAWALPVAGVVLAAGFGRRMGRNKLLLDVGGTPLVCHVVRAASDGGCHTVFVVHADEAVRRAVGNSATCIHNPEAASGMASSLRRGLAAPGEEIAGALVLLGDQPLVGARSVRMILNAWRKEGARPAVASSYGGRDRWQPPVLVDRSLWPELSALEGDAGARQVLARRPELLDTVLSAGRPDDVDTPEDYANIVRLFPGPDKS